MTNTKTTKRALLASVLSVVMCISMLIGSTFAWFTDTASTNVNKIQSGTLKVDLVNANGESLKGKTLKFNDKDDNALWEPGCTYTLNDVYVVNNGNLALEYKIVITGIEGSAKLNEAIEWTITGTADGVLMPNTKSGEITITGHMKENAGNLYQGLTIDGIGITVYAYQTPYEYDSNNNTYDEKANEDADEVKTATVVTAAQLQQMLTQFTDAGSGDGVINIAGDLVLAEGETWTPVNVDGYNGADVITINGNGYTITGLTAPLFSGGFAGGSGIVINDLTIADSTIVSTNTQGSGAFIECVDSMDTITLTNCHLKNSTLTGSRSGGLVGWTSGYDNVNDGSVKTYVTIDRCSVIGCTINGGSESVGAINGHAGANAWTFTTIKNCEIKNNILIGGSGKTGVILGTANVGEVTITGCQMENNTVNGSASENVYGRFVPGTTGKLTIDGNSVNN